MIDVAKQCHNQFPLFAASSYRKHVKLVSLGLRNWIHLANLPIKKNMGDIRGQTVVLPLIHVEVLAVVAVKVLECIEPRLGRA